MTPRTILGIFAHPDDELMAGGTLAYHAAHGDHVVIACVTGGEIGEISEPHLATPETLPTVRAAELRAAAAALGIDDVRLVGFRDSGMVGTLPNDDPRSLHSFDPQAATMRFLTLIREVRPHVVITHDPTGGYGHPDHIATSRYVTAAYDVAGDAAAFPEAGPAHQPQRLYYGVMARSFFETMRTMMAQAGVDTSIFNRPEGAPMGYADDAIDLSVDVQRYAPTKWAGFEAHKTQFGPNSPIRQMPPEVQQSMFTHEHYVVARPTGLRVARDGGLFDVSG